MNQTRRGALLGTGAAGLFGLFSAKRAEGGLFHHRRKGGDAVVCPPPPCAPPTVPQEPPIDPATACGDAWFVGTDLTAKSSEAPVIRNETDSNSFSGTIWGRFPSENGRKYRIAITDLSHPDINWTVSSAKILIAGDGRSLWFTADVVQADAPSAACWGLVKVEITNVPPSLCRVVPYRRQFASHRAWVLYEAIPEEPARHGG